jgi:MFS family permease
VSLLKPEKDFEPLELPCTAWVSGLYAAVAALLGVFAFILMSSSAYRENAGMTLEGAQRATRAALPVVLALLGSSVAFGWQAWLCWRSSPWGFGVGGVLIAATVLVAVVFPSSLRGYVFGAFVLQVVALSGFVWLTRRST